MNGRATDGTESCSNQLVEHSTIGTAGGVQIPQIAKFVIPIHSSQRIKDEGDILGDKK